MKSIDMVPGRRYRVTFVGTMEAASFSEDVLALNDGRFLSPRTLEQAESIEHIKPSLPTSPLSIVKAYRHRPPSTLYHFVLLPVTHKWRCVENGSIVDSSTVAERLIEVVLDTGECENNV